jgi:hypothetical protein
LSIEPPRKSSTTVEAKKERRLSPAQAARLAGEYGKLGRFNIEIQGTNSVFGYFGSAAKINQAN